MFGRLTAVTVIAVTTVALGGCSQEAEPAPAPATQTTSSPAIPSSDPRAAIVGTWRAEDADWTVHFNDDGTFSEDFEGNVDFRTGTFRVEDDMVYLDGGDGETNEGELSGDTINFKLGLLERS